MSNVLLVSIVDLWAEEAYFVIATPVALKQATVKIFAINYAISHLLLPISLKARVVSSRLPWGQI